MMTTKHTLAIVCSSLVIVLFNVVLLPRTNQEIRGRTDLTVYYVAAKVITGQYKNVLPADLYTKEKIRPLTQKVSPGAGSYYLYLPPATLLFWPFTLLRLNQAAQFWMVCNIGLFILAYYCIVAAVDPKGWWRYRYALLLIVLGLSDPVRSLIKTGQINALVLLCFALVWWSWRYKKRPVMIGVALGVATILKIFPLFTVPYFLFKREYRIALAQIGTIVVLCLITLPLIGLSTWSFYLTDRLPALLAGDIGYSYLSQSLYGNLRDIVQQGWLDGLGYTRKYIIAGVDIIYWPVRFGVAVVIGWLLWRNRHSNDVITVISEQAFIIAAIVAFSEIVHLHYLIWLIPIPILLLSQPPRQRWLQGLVIAFTILAFHSIHFHFPNIAWVIVPTTVGIVGLTVLAGYQLMKQPKGLSYSAGMVKR